MGLSSRAGVPQAHQTLAAVAAAAAEASRAPSETPAAKAAPAQTPFSKTSAVGGADARKFSKKRAMSVAPTAFRNDSVGAGPGAAEGRFRQRALSNS